MIKRTSHRAPPLLLWGAALCAAIAAIPLVYLVIRIGGAGAADIWAILTRLRTWETVATSVGLATVVVIACLLISYPTALLLTRTKLPLRRLWFTTVALPLAALILTMVSFPYVLLPLLISLRSADIGLEQVARSLGNKPVAAFFATTFRQSVPAAAAGSLLVALYVLSDFGAVALLRVDAFTRVIYTSYRASFDRTNAAVLAGMLVLLAVILISLERKARGRSLRFRADKGVASSPLPKALTPALSALSSLWFVAIATISLAIPVISLLIRLGEGRRRALDWAELLGAVANTAWVSALGAVIAVLLALPIAALASRFRSRSASTIESVSYSGLALPGVVIGLSLVFLSINTVPFLYQSFVLLAFAYAVLFLPKSLGASRTALENVPPALGQVAQTLGYKPLRAWLYTSGRISWPGIAAGGLLVMTNRL